MDHTHYPADYNDAGVGIEFYSIGGLMSGPSIYPEYLSDLNVLFCPSATNASEIDELLAAPDGGWLNPVTGQIDVGRMQESQSYYYNPWAAYENYNTQMTWFSSWYHLGGYIDDSSNYGSVFGAFDRDIDVGTEDVANEYTSWSFPEYASVWEKVYDVALLSTEPLGNGGSDTIYRLREGIERFLISDINNPAASSVAQSEMPIMHDVVIVDGIAFESGGEIRFNHVPGGGNVLYMDGHVGWQKYPSMEPPINPISAAAWY